MSRITEELLSKLRTGEEVRANLISLRAELKKNEKERSVVLNALRGEGNVLIDLLQHEDAKTRKNAALILGELPCEEAEEALYEAYVKEQQLFVRSSYLEALLKLGSEAYVPELTEQLKKLEAEEQSEDTAKHRAEERKLLRELLSDAVGVSRHTFTGVDKPAEIVLMTNRNHIGVTVEQLIKLFGDKLKYKEVGVGVRLIVEKLTEVLSLRTYEELLFVIPGMGACPCEVKAAAKVIAESELIPFLERRHAEKGQAYRFRIEYRGKLEPEQKGKFLRQLSAELETLTKHRLVNSTSDYELEIRMIENKEGRLNLLVKLFTFADERFAYRKEAVAASIRPANAALTMELAKDYLKQDAQVLDPFCGVGTMLVERAKMGHVGNLYGIDSFGEAIEKARKNTEAAGLFANYINRDFFDFKHEYLFDELITDMPFLPPNVTDKNRQAELEQLYRKFFVKAKEHLKEGAVLVLYVRNPELVKKYAERRGYRMEKEFEINKIERSYVFVLQLEGDKG